MLMLYQFPVSHYCEIARWGLDYKQQAYQKKNLLPGLHVKRTRKLTGESSVPILVHDGRAIRNSSDILSHLDSAYPHPPLLPQDPELQQQALQWETLANEQIGPHIRRIIYHELLEYPKLLIPFFTTGGPWYGPLVVRWMFPRLRAKMRELMDINDVTATESLHVLDAVVPKVLAQLDGKDYLVGEQFSRADLVVAALLAPLATPVKYGLDWPAQFPESVQAVTNRYPEAVQWTQHMYERHR